MANAVFYSNNAQQTTLSGSISSAATSITVGATTGFPSSFPYTLALDYGAATEELVSVTAAAGTNLTVTRGYGSTSAQSHSLGAVVRHTYDATDATAFRTHEAATAAVHGVAGTLVGTSDTQTLSNKTLTSPTINTGALSGTFTGTPTFSGAVTLSGGGALTGTFTGSPTLSGNPNFTGTPTFAAASFSNTATFTGQIAVSNLVRGSRTLATDSQYEARVTGDPAARWFMDATGKQWWSSGAAGPDTNLYRSGADTLATDDSFVVGGDLSVAATTWTSFTPAWTIGGSPATTTNVGWHKKVGKIVFFEVYTVWSAAGTGSSQVAFALPSTPFRDGNGPNTTRQLASAGWAVNLNIASNGAVMGQVLAGGTGGTCVVAFYDTSSFQGQHIVNGTIMTLQGWYREA